jgi:hypothetical protein
MLHKGEPALLQRARLNSACRPQTPRVVSEQRERDVPGLPGWVQPQPESRRANIAFPMPPLSEWQTLFSVQAECAATLTGLVFVAVSINLTKILASPGLPGRAAESIAQFLQVFFICSAGLIPGLNTAALGLESVVVVLLCWVLQILSQVNYVRSRSGHPKWWLIARTLKTHMGSIPLFVASFYLLEGSPAGLYWLVPGFLLSFLAGVVNAWILLIEINR